MKKISICGIPSGLGCALPGTQHGPNALRQKGLIEKLKEKKCLVEDQGDVFIERVLTQDDPSINAKHLSQITEGNKKLHTMVSKALDTGNIPLTLGGDHSFAIGSISAVYQHCLKKNKPLHVIWFDAHTDFNTPQTSPTGNIHGMPVKVLTGDGPTPLKHILEPTGFIPESAFSMIGIRSVDPLEQVAIDQSHISVFTMDTLKKEGLESALNKIFSTLSPEAHVHFSFDIDGIDPSLAPGVGTPVQGGLSLEETQQIFQKIKDSGLLGSMDVFELNPEEDHEEKTAALAIEMVASLF